MYVLLMSTKSTKEMRSMSTKFCVENPKKKIVTRTCNMFKKSWAWSSRFDLLVEKLAKEKMHFIGLVRVDIIITFICSKGLTVFGVY